MPAPIIGRYGTDYLYRAGVAALGLGANTRAEAVYPTAYTDSELQPLDGKHSYRLVFDRDNLPPVRSFWSLTLYDADGWLVANPLKRYAIGNTHPPLVRRRDGRVVVVVQSVKPTEQGVNWLPAPPGPFRLNLRLYWPKKTVLNGTWKPPGVLRQD